MSRSILLLGLCTSLFFVCTIGCKHEYQKKLDQELASGERNDSIFLDMHLGMHKKAFYDRCWKLNKEGLIRQGDRNNTVQFNMNINEKKAIVNFFPDFHEDRIYQMPVTYRYQDWSPWLKHFWSDTLQLELVDIYKTTFGDDFMEIEHPKLGKAFVQVDGNRRISIYKKGDQDVRVIFTDLLIEPKVPKNTSAMADENLPIWMKEAQKQALQQQ